MLNRINPHISRALFITVIVSVFSMMSIGFSYMFKESTEQEELSAKRAMKIWKNKIDDSRQNNNIIDEYETEYLALVKDRIIGEEDRLSWYEIIQATSESRGMPSVKYTVGSQDKLNTRRADKRYKGLEIYRSVMTMDMELGHEGDLFALMNNLERQANGLPVVDSCELERRDSGEQSSLANNFEAYCEMSWYTIRSQKRGS